MNNPFYGYVLSVECLNECSAQGRVDDAVAYWTKEMKLTTDFDRKGAIDYLREYGAWSIDELNESSDEALAQRCLWLYCCDVKENPDEFEIITSEVIR